MHARLPASLGCPVVATRNPAGCRTHDCQEPASSDAAWPHSGRKVAVAPVPTVRHGVQKTVMITQNTRAVERETNTTTHAHTHTCQLWLTHPHAYPKALIVHNTPWPCTDLTAAAPSSGGWPHEKDRTRIMPPTPALTPSLPSDGPTAAAVGHSTASGTPSAPGGICSHADTHNAPDNPFGFWL